MLSKLRFFTQRKQFDAQKYWQLRHQSHLNALTGVGHICLTSEQNNADYEVKVANVLSTLTEAVGDLSGTTILDAGCGIGIYTAALIERGAKVVGVDFSPQAIDIARSAAPAANFHVTCLDSLPFKAEFDSAIIIDVLFHILEDNAWEKTLTSLLMSLKPGGCLLIQECFASSEMASHVRWRNLDDYETLFKQLDANLLFSNSYRLPQENVSKTLLIVTTNRNPKC